jgi:TRAP transporter 4TM/12TM fusion protein
MPTDTVEQDKYRHFGKWGTLLINCIAFSMFVFHIWALVFTSIDPWFLRTYHLAFGAILALVLYPAWGFRRNVSPIDIFFMATVIGFEIYLYFQFSELIYRAGALPTRWDVVFALFGTLMILDITRRTIGSILPCLAVIFVLYAKFGYLFPGIFHHKGYTWSRILSYLFSLQGVFGVTLSASAAYVFLFIVFGAFLQASGGGKWFMDLAFAVAGKTRGGPAKVAIIASALFGTMSGSSVGNVVTTGSFTIPMMKKIGYLPRFAGAVESVASTGGQIMPPIMGAGAFIMAEILAVSYLKILAAAIIPAILYFASVILMVDVEAVKRNLSGLPKDELPQLRDVMRECYRILPVVVIILLLAILHMSIARAAVVGIVMCILVSWPKKATRMGPKKIFRAGAEGAKSAVGIVATCATAGIVIGIVSLTGLGIKFASAIISLSHNILFFELILTMVVCIILGMGLPTTAAYAVCASVVTPALIRSGVDPLASHLFAFYFACISAITPPVAIAAYAAAGIAGDKPMRVAGEACKLGIAAFLVPYMFVLGPPLLMNGSVTAILMAFCTSLIGVLCLAYGVQGWLISLLPGWERILLILAACCFLNHGWQTDVLAMLILVSIFCLEKRKKRKLAHA